jgi:hypothetical protein
MIGVLRPVGGANREELAICPHAVLANLLTPRNITNKLEPHLSEPSSEGGIHLAWSFSSAFLPHLFNKLTIKEAE